jgi:hypothetical protein
MNNYPTKNGLPWTSIYKFPEPVAPEKLSSLKKIWDDEDWGEQYQNNMREPAQGAIYPHTRRLYYNPMKPAELTNEILKKAILDTTEDVKKLFPIPMTLLYSELTLLVPNGTVRWHHDRLKTATFATRVMIPLTSNNDIIYSFCSWKENTPNHNPRTSPLKFMADDVYEVEMKPGFYYTFNHRVPHKTESNSPEPRGILSFDMIPTEHYKPSNLFSPITEFEKTKILPPQNYP